MKILFICSAGMSSAIAANALQKEADKEDINLEVFETSTQGLINEIEKDYVLIMVAPQIRHRYSYIKEECDKKNIPCILIEPRAYSPLGGSKLLNQVKKELNI